MSNKGVKFIKDTHQYFSDENEELISVSAFVKKFKVPVDWKAKAKKKSEDLLKYEGIKMSPKEVEALWEKKRVLGSGAGTILHDIKEQERLVSGKKVKHSGFKDADKKSIPLQDLEDGWIYPELMIYDFEHMLCGQSDEVAIHKGAIWILDYKTDKAIEWRAWRPDKGSRNAKFHEPAKFKPPISHLEDCNGNEYTLKMSLYMYMLWKASKGKYKIGKIILRWCPLERDKEGIPILYDGKPKILKEEDIEVPYKKKEVEAMLAHYKKNKA
jgi:hypothetical protein